MELPGTSYLYNLTLISVTFAGFAALIAAFRQMVGGRFTRHDAFLIRSALVRSLIVIVCALLPPCAGSHAADIRVLGTQSMVLVWNEIATSFERQTGHKVVMTPHIAAAAKKMVDAGERFDVAILSPGVIDQLIKENKVVTETRVDIMRVGIAVAVRAGQPKPDITSVEAFKAALLKAGTIAHLKTGERCLIS
jgi:ABC-type molybdate transport system substrate-binding protein